MSDERNGTIGGMMPLVGGNAVIDALPPLAGEDAVAVEGQAAASEETTAEVRVASDRHDSIPSSEWLEAEAAETREDTRKAPLQMPAQDAAPARPVVEPLDVELPEMVVARPAPVAIPVSMTVDLPPVP